MTTATGPNAPLLLQTLHHIENHPEELDQTRWHCGTTACYAGHAAILDGGEWHPQMSIAMVARDDDPPEFLPGGRIPVSVRARHILGLTGEQAGWLFDGANTLDDLRGYVYRFVGDWEKLAEVTERAATNAINTRAWDDDAYVILPSAYADPALNLDEKHQRWDDLKDAIRGWQAAGDPDAVLDCEAIGTDHDPETYVNHLRGLVDDAIHALIGAPQVVGAMRAADEYAGRQA